ncbi:50S ribosomal protein L10 [Candidatus Berkelbacteria bacterium CG08_land_8_20_14_0_20_39_8]|uniref:Large ribosomal subunit protein uL10 n=1 Tax=Candidatus Berkelbacteria bacterium CG08_land_8_20_14_0_20_39_8 TaxID=1974511 RepID=A0A2M6YCF7_9BACT|nr:MAG: 50S ribosomal protein L10 [Candidatus Berkelbacteria bacterium CG08_land_8_20_14_0_20_39_8]
MAKTRIQKKEQLAKLNDQFGSRKAVFVDYQGLSVFEMENLRNALEEKGVTFGVVKNTLAKIALEKLGIEIENEILKKPIAVAFSDDEVMSSKELKGFSKNHEKMEILGGVIDDQFVPTATINALALLPSREELYTKVVGSIAAPISGMVNVLAGNIRGLVSVLKQYSDQKS